MIFVTTTSTRNVSINASCVEPARRVISNRRFPIMPGNMFSRSVEGILYENVFATRNDIVQRYTQKVYACAVTSAKYSGCARVRHTFSSRPVNLQYVNTGDACEARQIKTRARVRDALFIDGPPETARYSPRYRDEVRYFTCAQSTILNPRLCVLATAVALSGPPRETRERH